MVGDRKNACGKRSFLISLVITLALAVVSVALCWFVYASTARSFFQATVDHTMDTMEVMRDLGVESVDTHLRSVKTDVKSLVAAHGDELLQAGDAASLARAIAGIEPSEQGEDLWYLAADGTLTGVDGAAPWAEVMPAAEPASLLASSETHVLTPGYNAQHAYVMAVVAPVLVNGRVAGVLIERYDGYLASEWIAELTFEAGDGVAYLVEGSGRNIAASRAESYEWFETEYNATASAAETGDEQDASVAELEQRALRGETGLGTYAWEGQTSYLAYGPLEEADWGFYVGFYGASLEAYANGVVSQGSGPAQTALALLVIALGAVALVSVRSLNKERAANNELVRRKEEIERQAEALAASEARFKVALEKTGNIVFDYDMESGAIQCFITPEHALCCEATADNLREGLVSGGVVEESSLGLFCDALDDVRHGAQRAECMVEVLEPCGDKLWYRASLSSLFADGEQPKRAIGVLEDVTRERAAQFDSLTGLLDRKAAVEMAEAYLASVDAAQRFAFVMMDVDHFKEINDTYGHLKGDDVLRALAGVLDDAFEKSTIVARYGGDEFCMFFCEVSSVGTLEALLRSVNERFRVLCKQGLCPTALSCSFGATVRQGPGYTFEQLLGEADEALYAAKRDGRNTCAFYRA